MINFCFTYRQRRQTDGAFGVYDEARKVAKRTYVIIDEHGYRYLNIRPSGAERDLLSTPELLNEVKKVNRGG